MVQAQRLPYAFAEEFLALVGLGPDFEVLPWDGLEPYLDVAAFHPGAVSRFGPDSPSW